MPVKYSIEKEHALNDKLRLFIKREIVLVISLIAAILSCFFVDSRPNYLEAIHFHTLFLLSALMIAVEGLASTGLFSYLAVNLVQHAKNSRRLCLVFGLITCFAAMFLTNDVALLVFVPFAIRAFTIAKDQGRSLMITCVVMTLGAIVGASLTPIGNPHNLYLYDYFEMTPLEFFSVSVPMVLIGIALIILWSRAVPKRVINTVQFESPQVNPHWKNYAFLLILCTVFSILHLPTEILLLLVGIPVFFLNRALFKRINYSLLLTFTCFFILVANLTHIDQITQLLTALVSKNAYLAAVIACQFISNVPASVALSPFTQAGTALMVGTNVGGLGMIYASMASLITFRLYNSHAALCPSLEQDEKPHNNIPAQILPQAISCSYLRTWTLMSISCLIVFIIAGLLLHW